MQKVHDKEQTNWPILGCGVGLRSEHYAEVLENRPEMDWFEAISENFMDTGGRPFHILGRVREHYPVALHGVSLSIGSVDPINLKYLERLKALADRIEPFIVSDHLCWTGVEGQQTHDLLPLPFTEEALAHIIRRASQVQDYLKRPILLENVSSYVTYRHSTIPEWEFLSEAARRSGCGILLDLNNIYVNARNHQFDPLKYLEAIPRDKVGQFHLAGHTDMGEFLFDTHSGEVIDPVWDLYRAALVKWGKVSTLIEWDENIPEFRRLAEEAGRARKLYNEAALNPGGGRIEKAAENLETTKLSSSGTALDAAQKWFKRRILPYGAAEKEGPESLLNPQGSASGEERLSVYANGYAARMTEALKEVYEAVHLVLGEDPFHRAAARYASGFPSLEYNLSLAGRHFPLFLAADGLTSKLPFLPDLAGLEWKVAEAFHAFDFPPLTAESVQSIPPEQWENIIFEFQPSMKLLASMWPVFDIWIARKRPADQIKVELKDRPQCVLVYRHALEVRCVLISRPQFDLLAKLKNGISLGRACEDFEDAEETPPLQEWFSQWIQAGMIAGVKFHEGDAEAPAASDDSSAAEIIS